MLVYFALTNRIENNNQDADNSIKDHYYMEIQENQIYVELLELPN